MQPCNLLLYMKCHINHVQCSRDVWKLVSPNQHFKTLLPAWALQRIDFACKKTTISTTVAFVVFFVTTWWFLVLDVWDLQAVNCCVLYTIICYAHNKLCNQLSFVKAMLWKIVLQGECLVCNSKDELHGHFVLSQRIVECKFNQM